MVRELLIYWMGGRFDSFLAHDKIPKEVILRFHPLGNV